MSLSNLKNELHKMSGLALPDEQKKNFIPHVSTNFSDWTVFYKPHVENETSNNQSLKFESGDINDIDFFIIYYKSKNLAYNFFNCRLIQKEPISPDNRPNEKVTITKTYEYDYFLITLYRDDYVMTLDRFDGSFKEADQKIIQSIDGIREITTSDFSGENVLSGKYPIFDVYPKPKNNTFKITFVDYVVNYP